MLNIYCDYAISDLLSVGSLHILTPSIPIYCLSGLFKFLYIFKLSLLTLELGVRLISNTSYSNPSVVLCVRKS
nr:MAG TPA: hypothetical protein [Bacteriophage sp.]